MRAHISSLSFQVTFLTAIFPIYLFNMLAKSMGDTDVSTNYLILTFRLFLNNPAIKIYFTVIIIIFGISLDQQIDIHNNTKSVFTN